MNDEKVDIWDDELSKIVEQLNIVKDIHTGGDVHAQHFDEFIREVGRLEGLLDAIIRPKHDFLDDDGLPGSVGDDDNIPGSVIDSDKEVL